MLEGGREWLLGGGEAGGPDRTGCKNETKCDGENSQKKLPSFQISMWKSHNKPVGMLRFDMKLL